MKALFDVIEHEELRTRIGHNARLWAREHLSHTTLVQETQDLYERLLKDQETISKPDSDLSW